MGSIMPAQCFNHRRRQKLIQQKHMGARQKGCVQGKAKPMNVKKRQGMADYIFFIDFPYIDYISRIMNKVS